MKKVLLAIFALACMGYGHAQAQLTGNLGFTTDYRFRGVSQTQNAPAVQGGIDYAHRSGFYAGNWNSSVSGLVYSNGSGMESDLYAGFKTNIAPGVSVDVGSYNYLYPRATTTATSNNYDTNEVYMGVGYRDLVAARYSHTVSDGYFGVANAKNTRYFQLDTRVPVVGFKNLSVVAHAGYTDVANSDSSDYADYNVGIAVALPQGWEGTAKYFANTGITAASEAANTVNGQKLQRNAVVFAVSKSF